MAGISLDRACFLALVLETVLYGAFCVLFGAAVWVITRRKGRINVLLLSTVSTIWILSTVHWILDVIRAAQAFVDLQDGSALAYYADLSNPLQAAKTAIYVTLTMVGDGFVIFRCYVVWGRRWQIAVLPLMLLCGTGAAGYGATVAFSRAAPGAAIFLPNIVPWVTGFIAMTLSTNVVCTVFIAARILAIQRTVRHIGQTRRARSAVVVIAESASVYSSALIALISTYLSGSNAQYTVLDLTSPLIGITFTVIILRVSLGLSSHQTAISTAGGPSYDTGRYAMGRRPVAVNVSHLVESDNEPVDVFSSADTLKMEASSTKHNASEDV